MTESLDRSAGAATLPRQANGAPDASGAADTNVPRPTYPRTRPRDSSSRYALTTVVRLTRSHRASPRSAGRRSPGVERAVRDAVLEGGGDVPIDRPCARQLAAGVRAGGARRRVDRRRAFGRHGLGFDAGTAFLLAA